MPPPSEEFRQMLADAIGEVFPVRFPYLEGHVPEVVWNNAQSFWSLGFTDGLRFVREYPKLAMRLDGRMKGQDHDGLIRAGNDIMAAAMSEELSPTTHFDDEAAWFDHLTALAESATVEEERIPLVPLAELDEKGRVVWEVMPPWLDPDVLWEMEQRGAD